MRAISRILIAVAATLMIAAVPVMAEENMMGQQNETMSGQQDETINNRECVLVARNCPTESLQSRIDRIQTEINRGTDAYTKEELRRLQDELNAVQSEFENDFVSGGA
jgi:peptidoglycan hydrolase CwlO-like protein